MRTLLITGSDTGIGKTRITGLLAALLPEQGQTVRIVKPVETGVDADGDAGSAAAFARSATGEIEGLGDHHRGHAKCPTRRSRHQKGTHQTEHTHGGRGSARAATTVPASRDGPTENSALFARSSRDKGLKIEAYTLRRFPEPLAPVAAAALAGEALDPDSLLAEINRLPDCDWRLIEGAGGLAVPLDRSGRDWADFAAALPGVHVVLVVPDRLGAINQARLTAHYARSKGLDCSLWLNETVPADRAVRDANREGVSGDNSLPLFRLGFQANVPENAERVAAFYRGLPSAGTAPLQDRRQAAANP